MFSHLNLSNFKSLTDIKIDFCTSNKPKKLILIYGENGSGKTNIVEAFALLKTLSDTISNQMRLAGIVSRLRERDEDEQQNFTELVRKRTLSYDLDVIFNSVRSLNSSGDIIIEYGFCLNNKNGFYRLVYGDKLKEESLYFTLDKKAGYLFKITKGSKPIMSSHSFTNSDYRNSLNEKIAKFWGKHTLIAIINHDFNFMNENYVSGSISEPLHQVINFINHFSIQLKRFDSSEDICSTHHKTLFALDEGDIPNCEIGNLDTKAKLVRLILTSLYSDIKDIYYKFDTESNKKLIHYKLFLKKIIGGKIRDIDFSYESSGTKNLLRLILPLSEAVLGNVSIIDEGDTGMHDLLFCNMIERASESLKGQLIVTTHNTTLLNLVQKDAIHFLVVNALGNKKLVSVSDFPMRTQQNHNIQNRYLQGVYEGVPSVGYLDFSEIQDLLED